MAFSWMRKGLRTGVLTTRYPAVQEQMPEGFRGRLVLDAHRCLANRGCDACVQVCLPAALELRQEARGENDGASAGALHLALDYARCIMCGLCVAACPTDALRMTGDYELAAPRREDLRIINVLEVSPALDMENGKEKNNGRPA
jgi:formate hydrogenlyase subunit 6/NADH:ubiquinone oxidoreductase subunit I